MKHFISISILLLSVTGYSQSSLKTQTANNSDLDQYLWSFSKNKTQSDEKKQIDFDAMDNWRGLGYYLSVSDDGNYFAYTINRPTGTRLWFRRQDSLVIQGTKNNWRQAFAVSTQGVFSADGKQYIFQNGNVLCLLQLGAKQTKEVKDVSLFKLDAKNNWLAYQVKGKDSLILQNLSTRKQKQFAAISDFDFDPSGDWLVGKNNAKELLIYNPATGTEKRFSDVMNYTFSSNGKGMVIKTSTSLQYISLPQGAAKNIWTIKEKTGISSYSLDASGQQVVLNITDSEDAGNNAIAYYQQGMDKAVVKINNETEGIPGGLIIRNGSFTSDGKYIQLSLQAKSIETGKPLEEKAGVEVWNSKDLYLQSEQAERLNRVANYIVFADIETGKVVYQETDDKKLYLQKGDFALIKKDYKAVEGGRFWESKNYRDSIWIVFLKDGRFQLLPTNEHENYNQFSFSPDGDWLVYFDMDKGCHYYSYNLHTSEWKNISATVADNQLGIIGGYSNGNDQAPPLASLAAWVDGQPMVLVYDNYDIWKLDLTGKQAAVNITSGFGQSKNTVLNLLATDRNASNISVIKANESLILLAFNRKTKQNGFCKKANLNAGAPAELYMGDYFMRAIAICHDGNVSNDDGIGPMKAGGCDIWIVQRQSTNDAPNYYATTDFTNFKRLTNYQPQKNYEWFTEELHSFKYVDGKMGQGILYKPENFDPKKKYPVLIAFYGAFSNNMYKYPVPTYLEQAMESGKSPLWLLNNGYLIFTPDIAVAPLKYGPKAFSVIEGAAQYLTTLPYVDGNRLGTASHSWSGKLGAYIFTHSKSIAATAITEGFLYANPTVQYLSSKNSQEGLKAVEVGMQYGSLWENKDLWLDQTTILNVDKSTSPLLLLCNKESSEDYQEQTFQFFNALRRLDKKVWWLKYDNGEHTLYDLKERKDYTIRYTQFFDHYLKNAPAPMWMTQGIPYKLKGIESRYELDPQGTCNAPNGEPCPICQAWNKQYKKTPEMFQKEIKDWILDKDIADELERKQNEKRKELDKEGEVRTREVMRMLGK